MPSIDDVIQEAERQFDSTIEVLSNYLRIPAISCEKEHAQDVDRLAEKVRDDLEGLGMERSRVLRLPDALPIVAAEWLHAGEDKPTILVYGHMDLQPVAGEPWDTEPHEPVMRGERLFARGSADDMGGWVSHMAAVKAFFAAAGTLPVNLKLIIEGEEEIGSPNLERYMGAYGDVFASDVMILTDCENPSTEIPGLTVSLRGLLEVEVICEALTQDVHSGLWGNVAPDASTALFKLIARLIDEDGRFTLRQDDVPDSWQARAWDIPLDDDVVRLGAHVRDDVSPLPARGRPPAEWAWRQPAITVLSTTLPSPAHEKNALRTRASATLSIRIAPGHTADDVRAHLQRELLNKPAPGGVKVSLEEKPGGAESWLYTPSGPAFDAADAAYEKAWGHLPIQIGVGGSIPFVAIFGRRFGNLPLILNGVMDPETGAHGPNESMHLGVFKRTIHANIHLLNELSTLNL